MKYTIMALVAAMLAGCGDSGAAKKESSQDADTKTRKETMTGAYARERTPDEAELTLFGQMTKGLTGVVYTPESVATQVVAGTNYRFVCKAQPTAPGKPAYRVEIVVYQPLPGQGDARITLLRQL